MKVTVLHTTNTRDAQFYDIAETREALIRGEYCLAGEFEVEFDADNGRVLEAAWTRSQNDNYPNPVFYRTGGKVADDFNQLDAETRAGIEQEIRRVGRDDSKYKIRPAEWNGKFPQRSTMAGDIVIANDNVFVVAGCGFDWVGAEITFGDLKLAKNSYNPFADITHAINHAFDDLITD